MPMIIQYGSVANLLLLLTLNCYLPNSGREADRLTGVWHVVGAITNGVEERPDDCRGGIFVFRAGRCTIVHPGTEEGDEFAITIGLSTRPMTLDMVQLSSTGATARHFAIVRIDGDTMHLCIAENGASLRPSDFVSPPGLHFQALILKKRSASPNE